LNIFKKISEKFNYHSEFAALQSLTLINQTTFAY